MTWTKLCDNIFADPRLLRVRAEVGHCAALLHIEALVYSNRVGTDGRIDRWCLPAVTSMPPRDVARWVEGLVAAGVWTETETGWQVVSGLADQPSAEQIAAKRAEVSAARSAAGKAGAKARWADGKMANGMAKPSQSHGNREWQSDGPVPSRPVPVQEEGYTPRVVADGDGAEGGPQSPEDAPSGGSPIVDAAEVEAALHTATAGALRLAAAPSTQSAAIVRHLRAAGVTRAELVYVTAALRDPGAIWDWAKGVKVTAGWLAGKVHPGTHEHDCSRLQEVVAHARALAAKAAREDAARTPIARPSTPAEDPATAGARARAILSKLHRTQPS